MFCRNCGSEVHEKAVFCISCGCPPSEGNKYCPNCKSETSPQAIVCVKCGVSLKNNETQSFAEAVKGEEKVSRKDWLTVLLLCIFLGPLGIHRFYVGRTMQGIISLAIWFVPIIGWLAGLIWWIIDLVAIITQKYTDKEGGVIVNNKKE